MAPPNHGSCSNHRALASLCLALLLAWSATANAGTRFCDDATAKLVASAYVLSIPLLDKHSVLQDLINANKGAFGDGGAATRCMRALGSALMQQSITQYQRSNPHAAQERFGGQMPAELAHLPGQVDRQMQSAGTEFVVMSQELLWLSQVLPAALKGDAGPYNQQGTIWRQTMLRDVMPQVALMCSLGYCQLIQGMLGSVIPATEEQIFLLATGRY